MTGRRANVRVEERGKADVVICSGGFDHETYMALEEAVEGLLACSRFNIVVDLTEISYMCSGAWGVFLKVMKRIKRGSGKIVISGMSAEVKAVYDMLELYEFVESYDNIDKAVQSF
ncbi:MAG TPA: anti-sigma factor antagonist [bacterium]|nr:anti-sigma factor antagonist [bacterium]